MRLKSVGDHDCDVPSVEAKDDQDFVASHEWICPDCKSRWVIQSHAGMLPSKFRISGSSTQWKRAQFKRMVNKNEG